jgi:hypothetical protein
MKEGEEWEGKIRYERRGKSKKRKGEKVKK